MPADLVLENFKKCEIFNGLCVYEDTDVWDFFNDYDDDSGDYDDNNNDNGSDNNNVDHDDKDNDNNDSNNGSSSSGGGGGDELNLHSCDSCMKQTSNFLGMHKSCIFKIEWRRRITQFSIS
jgi:hypothetical protein